MIFHPDYNNMLLYYYADYYNTLNIVMQYLGFKQSKKVFKFQCMVMPVFAYIV